jgi:ribonuclease HI
MWCYRAATRLASLPDKHPLKKPVRLSARGVVKRHRSPLHNLLSMIDTNIHNIAAKPIEIHNPARPPNPLFRVSIPPDKESSKKEVQENTDTIQVFTDGSIINNKVGAAAILTRPGKEHRTLHYHLSKATEYTIFDVELAGLSMGMHLINTEKAARHSTTLGVDNQAAINAIQNELSTTKHYVMKDILQTSLQIKKTRGSRNYVLTLRWMAGHTGINGNELVDEEAKKAAKGQSSNPKLLPCILRHKLKISTAAIKQHYKRKATA